MLPAVHGLQRQHVPRELAVAAVQGGVTRGHAGRTLRLELPERVLGRARAGERGRPEGRLQRVQRVLTVRSIF